MRRRTAGPSPTLGQVGLDCSPVAQVERLVAQWGSLTDGTRARLGGLCRRFARRLEALHVRSIFDATGQDCEEFIWAVTRRGAHPSMHTVHLRRTALRTLYRSARDLGVDCPDPTVWITLPGRPTPSLRPLIGREIDLVRTAALGRERSPLRAAAAVALAEATGTTSEIARLDWADINLTDRTVRLAGASPIRARIGQLTAWGAGALTRYQQHTSGTGPVLARRANNGDPHVAQVAVSTLLTRLLTTAGLKDATVKPGSIRLWGAAQTLATAGIEAAALALGVDSLDTAAHTLGHDWRNELS